MDDSETYYLSLNKVVAYNLQRARTQLKLTQEQAAARLEPYLGTLWSKATWSAAERSWQTFRVKRFNADELYALARAFELPITYFLTPPPGGEFQLGARVIERKAGREQTTGSSGPELLELVFAVDSRTRENIMAALGHLGVGERLRILRRIAAGLDAAVEQLEGEIAEAAEVAEELRNPDREGG